eukprot:TRINITY_DN28994_c0_g1_i1.p1 TRINITY_DN28994_c0_g1~~TRINITY_DN28994_c0_g1_i1.p1  ORF type:complete len:322 (-),score=52.36 TRINITY_DN28994_c0_g1_i1:70-1035(-)
MTRYWSDEAYQQFYDSSATERSLLNPSGDRGGARCTSNDIAGGASASTCVGASLSGRRGASGETRAGGGRGNTRELRGAQLDAFQQSFAEWSFGHGGVRYTDFRRFLAQVGVELSAAQATCLWSEVIGEEEMRKHMTYDEAFQAYSQVTKAPVKFKRAPGSAPPGANLGERTGLDGDGPRAVAEDPADVGCRGGGQSGWRLGGRGGGEANASEAGGVLAVDAAAGPSRDWGARAPGARGPERRGSGLGLMYSEARDFLCGEGLPSPQVEAFLSKFSSHGTVPQTDLFDFVSSWAAGTQEQGGDVGGDAVEPTPVATTRRVT